MKQYQIKKAPLIRPATRLPEPHCCCQRPYAISQPRFGTSGLQSFDASPNVQHLYHHMQPTFQPAGPFQPQAIYQPSTMLRTPVQYQPIAPSYQAAPTVQQASQPRKRVEYVVMPKGDAPPNEKSAK